MADLNQLYDALRQADAAGNTEDAKKLANYIRSQSAAPAPTLQKAPEDVGFFEAIPAAAKRGVEQLGEVATGLGLAAKKVVGDEEAVRKVMAQAKEQKFEEKPGMTVTDFERIAKEQGFAAAAAQAPKYIVEQVLQSAPQMAGPLAVGVGAAALSGPLAPIVGPVAGIATYGVQQFGNFLMRQAQEKKDPEELELTKAALTAAGTAPLGYFADRFTVGLSSLGKNVGEETLKELAARRAAGEVGAGAVGKEIAKRAGKGAAVGIIAEAPTEVLEQLAERYQAGLELTGDEARNEYREAFFGAAAAGGGIGAGARGATGYAQYRGELGQARAEAGLPPGAPTPTARENAIEEATTYETTGAVPRTDQPGVSVPTEEGQAITGITEPTGGDLGGVGQPPAGFTDRKVALDNQLNELRGQQAEIARFDPTDPRVGEIDEVIKELQAERNARVFTSPSQDSFEFIEPIGKPDRKIATEASTPTEFQLTAPAGVVPETAGIEAMPEPERARMMLIGEPTNPTKPLNAFFNSLKPDTVNPAQSVAFRNEVSNLLDEVAEFVGAPITKQVTRFEGEGKGPDVSTPATGPELTNRMQFLNNFFDGISAAPKEREALTSALSQRMAGMSAKDQSAALSGLTNVPKLNTLRGIRQFRTKLSDALGKFERSRIDEEEAALPYKLTDDLANMEPYTARAVSNAIRSIDRSTPEGAAAYAYFGPETGWRYSLAMRSAAFDLGAELNTYATAPFKGQNKDQAKLFRDWVEGNLPRTELNRFDATIKAYERMNRKGEEFNKLRDELKKEGGVARKYITMITRAPTGKEAANLVPDAGMGKYKIRGEVTKLDPTKFYPMHPTIQDRIANNDLQGALQFMARDPGRQASNAMKFVARYAGRLSELDLKAEIGINQQANVAAHLIRANAGPQRRMLLQQLESFEWGPQFIKEAGLDGAINDPKTMRQTLNVLEAIKAGEVKFKEDVIAPVYGQFMDTLEAYKEAVGVLDSLGSYSPDLNFININADLGGMNPATFLHEVTHAATVYALDKSNYNKLTPQQKEAVNELKELHELAVKKYATLQKFMPLSKMDEYGFNNVQEFVAELMSNERFQQVLKKMKYQDGKTSLWDRFVRFVKQMFGLDNIAGYSMARVNDILMAPPTLTKEAVVHNMGGRTAKRVSNGTMPTNPGYMSFLDKIFDGRPAWDKVRGGMGDFLDNVNTTTRKYYLGAFTLRQLNDLVGSRIPQFKTFIAKVEGMLDERNRRLEEVRKITNKWMRLQSDKPQEVKVLNGVMLDSTLQGKDPDKGPTGDSIIDNAWNKLSEESKSIYRTVRDYYKKNMQDYIDTIVENKKAELRTTTDINSPKYKAETVALEQNPEVKKVRDYFKKHTLEPYFPIRRFGRFSLQLREGKNKEFYLFESASDRKAFMRKRIPELQKELGRDLTNDEIKTRNSIQKLTSENLQDFTFLRDLKDIIQTAKGSGSAELKANIEESLEQLYFLTLPDQSIRKAFMNRKGTAGMDTDMLRAFTSSAFHMSYQQSRYKFSQGLYRDIDSAKQFINSKGGREGEVDAEYLGELEQRLGYIMNPTDTGTIPSFLSNTAFLWFMTAPASALVNMMGVPAIGAPVLSAKFGAANTVKKLAEYTKKFSTTGFRDTDGDIAFPSFSNKPGLFTPTQQRAFDQFIADGLIDITLSHDLVGQAEAPSNLYTTKTQTVMKWLSGMFHGAEKFNREIVSMSAFDMAYEKAKKDGYSDDAAYRKAIDIAKDLTYKSMFDYSTLNKPRYFQQPTAKVILQFKQFSQQMTYLLARSTYEWVGKSYTPDEIQDIRYQIKTDHIQNKPGLPPLTEQELDAAVNQYIKDIRTEARDRLGGTLGMTVVFAGASGLPLWWVVSGVMNAMHAVFGEDEEEYDFENWFKNWSEETFGGFIGSSISRGVVPQVLGADVASRMSLNDLWYRDTRNSPDNVTALQNMFINLLGPTAGLAVNTAKGLDQLQDGHIQRAFETWSPALVKNILKGGRFLEEGRATTIRGNELLGDITGSEIAVQALGFTPERLAQRQKANIETKTAEQKILSRRQALMDAFFMSIDNSDDDMRERVIEKISKFNQANPGAVILPDNIIKSIETRYKQRAFADSLGGMMLNKKLIGQLSEMADYGRTE
jgi:hypothetical protein